VAPSVALQSVRKLLVIAPQHSDFTALRVERSGVISSNGYWHRAADAHADFFFFLSNSSGPYCKAVRRGVESQNRRNARIQNWAAGTKDKVILD
jgi:hypothetical protein